MLNSMRHTRGYDAFGETRQIRMSTRQNAPDKGSDDSRTDLDTDSDDGSDQPRVTRRRAVASAAAVGVGGLGLTSLTGDTVSAEVTMGEFTATGDSATVSNVPSTVSLSTSGEWSVTAPNGSVEQVMLTLNAAVDGGDGADVASDRVFDATEGTFSLSGELIADHPDVTGEMFVPADADGEKTTPVRVAVIVSAVQNGEVVADARAEDTADVTVTKEGVKVHVGGSATIDVSPEGTTG